MSSWENGLLFPTWEEAENKLSEMRVRLEDEHGQLREIKE